MTDPSELADWLQARLTEYATTRDDSIRDEIQVAADWLAVRSAKRFANSGEPLDDLIQVARIGLMKSIERYDGSRGIPFAAFATPTMIGELKRHFRDHTWSVRVPRGAKDLGAAVTRAVEEMTAELGRSPSAAEIAQKLGIQAESVLEALEANAAYRTSSLDPVQSARIPDDKQSSTDLVLDREVLVGLLDQLPVRERTVVYLRFFDELTQAEIAARIGTSQVHVGRILSASLAQLRRLAGGGAEVDLV